MQKLEKILKRVKKIFKRKKAEKMNIEYIV